MQTLSIASRNIVQEKVNANAENPLISLLPYKAIDLKHKNLTSGLLGYQMLVNASLEAFSFFQKKDLEKFDALVGENACQIRTLMLILIAARDSVRVHEIEKQLRICKSKVFELLLPQKINELMYKGITLSDLLEKEKLHLYLNSDEHFIIQSYFLCKARSYNNDLTSICYTEKIEPKLLKCFGNVSSEFTYNLVSNLRKHLSLSSVKFIKEQAALINDISLNHMVSDNFTIKHGNLSCIPMFWTYKVILNLLQTKRIPLVISAIFVKETSEGYKMVGNEYILYDVLGKSTQFRYVENINDMLLNKYACVIQGIVCIKKDQFMCQKEWKKLFIKYSIIDIILAGAAHHRQYPDSMIEKSLLVSNDIEYENYKNMAEAHGFCLTNPSTFFIRHVYATKIGTEILGSAEKRQVVVS